jgi:hypothetical protein
LLSAPWPHRRITTGNRSHIVSDWSSSNHRRMMGTRQHRRRSIAPSPWPYRRRRMRLALASSLHRLRMGSKSAAPRDRGIACKGNRLTDRAQQINGPGRQKRT